MAKTTMIQPESSSIDTLVDTINQAARSLSISSSSSNEGEVSAATSDTDRSTHESLTNGPHKLQEDIDADGAKSKLLAACRTLISTVSGPTEILKNMALIDKHNLVSLQVINHYRIASIVPDQGDISIEDVASQCNLPSDALARILRQAMTYCVFYEPRTGYIAHTDTSREVTRLEPLLSYQLEICLQSSLSVLDWLKVQPADGSDDKLEEKHTAPFRIAHDTEGSWWDFANKQPEWNEKYGQYQALITKGGPHDVQHVVTGYDWASLGSALVVDIGGADGFVGTAIARSNPLLTVIVQDNPQLKESAEAIIPKDLQSRVVFTAHSFFDPQQAIGRYADVFFLRHILHDWDDESCLKILRNLTSCMKSEARIVLAEQVLPPPHKVREDAETERVMRALDMQMMVQHGGKERTVEDWEDLFVRADERLELVGCKKPNGSADSVMELRLKLDT